MEKATFAAGCFWGVEAAFRSLNGVFLTKAGYTGGATEYPSYTQVCSGDTGHAEAVQIIFDPHVIDYETLVNRFFAIHDPTQRNRQGPDVGSQYRSVIFYHNSRQKHIACRVKRALNAAKKFSRPIATHIEPITTFYDAEEYHQQYLEKRGLARCHT